MRKVEWLNPNKMKATSGCKTWNKAVACLTTGNVMDPGYISNYIRSFKLQRNPIGNPVEPGRLQTYDLDLFSRYFAQTGSWVRGEIIIALAGTKDGSGILYCLRHVNSNGKVTIHGFILTDTDHNFIKNWVTGRTHKSQSVIEFARPYLSTWEPLPAHEQLARP
jgi:hypothetical protein